MKEMIFEGMSSSEFSSQVLKRLPPLKGAKVYLEAGHFDPRDGATEFAKDSLRSAVKLLRDLSSIGIEGFRCSVGVLVDDLGLACAAGTTCAINGEAAIGATSKKLDDGELPVELEAILSNDSLVKRDRTIISSERTAKNRGIRQLKKLLARRGNPCSLSKNTDGFVTFRSSIGDIELARQVSENVWHPKCPLIMGQHYFDLSQELLTRFPNQQNLLLIDWSEISDRDKVVAGRCYFNSLARIHQLRASVINLFDLNPGVLFDSDAPTNEQVIHAPF